MKENKFRNLWTVLLICAVLLLLFVAGAGCDRHKHARKLAPKTVTVYRTSDGRELPGSSSDFLFWYIMFNNGNYYTAGPTTSLAPPSSFRDMSWASSPQRPGVTMEKEAEVVEKEQVEPEEFPPAMETEIIEAEGRDGMDIDETPDSTTEPSTATETAPAASDSGSSSGSSDSGGGGSGE